MFEFMLPDLGEGIHEGELLVWHVKEGDFIQEDDPLCDMETDKATVTIPSPKAGRIARLNGSPGATVHVGAVLVVIDDKKTDGNRDAQKRMPKESPDQKNGNGPDQLKGKDPFKDSPLKKRKVASPH